jgi:hypothetical protein
VHARETGLRIPPTVASFEECCFRAGDITALEANPTELGQRPTELAP